MSTVRHLREAGVVPPGFRVAGFTQSMDSPSADTCVALMKEALASAITHGHLQLDEVCLAKYRTLRARCLRLAQSSSSPMPSALCTFDAHHQVHVLRPSQTPRFFQAPYVMPHFHPLGQPHL